VVLLDGPMGAGKTTFTRALAVGLGVAHPGRVCSPTFTLCMVHAGGEPRPVTLVHVDLFRLADEEDEGMGGSAGFDALDLEEIAAEATAGDPRLAMIPRVLVVEWARKWRRPPSDRLEIRLSFESRAVGAAGDPGGVGALRRIVAVEAHGARSTAILAAWPWP
jgi:tRNA threonylcarbamoyladenosine biosynthesis protein TsaE